MVFELHWFRKRYSKPLGLMISISSFGRVSHRSSMLFLAKDREEFIQKKGKDFTRVMTQTEGGFYRFL